MGKRRGGIKDAAEMLQGLGDEASDRILEEIERKNPSLAQRLRENLLTIEDLEFLTLPMIRTLLREISPEMLGLALRGTGTSLIEFFFKQVSTSIKEEIERGYKGGPRPLSQVLEARQNVLLKVQDMIKKGKIILNKDDLDTLV